MIKKFLIILMTIMGIGISLYSESNTSISRVEVITTQKPYSHSPDDASPYPYSHGFTIILKRESPELISGESLFLISLIFPEIYIHAWGYPGIRTSPDVRYYLNAAVPDNFKNKIVEFIDDTYNKKTFTAEELQFFNIFNMTTNEYLFDDISIMHNKIPYIGPTEEQEKEALKHKKELKIIENELTQLISNTINANTISNQQPNYKLLSLMHLTKGFIQGWLDEFEDAIKTYDTIIGYGVDDYALTSSFYKARCVGALSSLSKKYGDLLYEYYRDWNLIPPFRKWVWGDVNRSIPIISITYLRQVKDNNQCKEANNIYKEILTKYKHLEKERKVIFMWMKEILAGKPLPESETQPEIDKKPSK